MSLLAKVQQILEDLSIETPLRFGDIKVQRTGTDAFQLDGHEWRRLGCAAILAAEHREDVLALIEMDSYFASQLTF